MADTRDSLNSTQEQLRQQQSELKEQKRLQKELARSQRKLARAQKKSKKVQAVNRIRQEGMWSGPVLLLNDRAVPVEFVDRPSEIVGPASSRNQAPKEEPKFMDYTAGKKFRIDYIIEDGDFFDAVCRIPEKPDMYVWVHAYNPFTGEWSGTADIGLSRDDVMERLVGRTITWDNTSTTSHASSNIKKTNKKAVRNTRAPKKPKAGSANAKAANPYKDVVLQKLAADLHYATYDLDTYEYKDQYGSYPSDEAYDEVFDLLMTVEGVDTAISNIEEMIDPDDRRYDDLLDRLDDRRRELASAGRKPRTAAKPKPKTKPRVAYDRAPAYGRR